MARTFEAMQKAEKEKQGSGEQSKLFTHYEPETFGYELLNGTREEYRKMKMNLLRLNGASRGFALSFLSSTRGEGTSTVLTHFGIILASHGEDVLLVDANLINPTLHQYFKLPREYGFLDLVAGQRSVKDVVKRGFLPGLSVITCGSTAPAAKCLLESAIEKGFVNEMRSEAKWVLFDVPPLNSCSDAMVLSRALDGVVLVVEAERTKKQIVRITTKSLRTSEVQVLGAILNKKRSYIPDWLLRRL